MAKVVITFEDEVAAFPALQLCEDNGIQHKVTVLENGQRAVLLNDADTVIQWRCTKETVSKIVPVGQDVREL